MEQVEQPVHRLRGITLISVSYLFERACYYGMRSLMVLYFLNVLGWDKDVAAVWYGLFTIAVCFTGLLGALVGDFLLGATTAMIVGLSVEALGCFCFAIPNTVTVIVGFTLFLLGNGIFKPNIQQQAGSLFRNKTKYMDAAFSVLYFAVNLGAFLGPITVGFLGDNGIKSYFSIGFVLAGIFALISIVPIAVDFKNLRNSYQRKNEFKPTFSSSSILALLATILLLPVFWAMYPLFGDLVYEAGAYAPAPAIPLAFIITIIISGPLSIAVWSFVKMESMIKIGVGFLLMTLPPLLLFTEPRFFAGVSYINGLAEALIAIPVLSVIARFAPPKLMGLFFGINMAMYYLTTKITNYFQVMLHHNHIALVFVLVGLSLFSGVLFFVLGLTLPKSERIA